MMALVTMVVAAVMLTTTTMTTMTTAVVGVPVSPPSLAGPPQYGEYEVAMVDFELPDVLDSTDPRAVVVYPTSGNFTTGSLPMVVYAHGAGGGGPVTYVGYKALFDGLASFGMVVVAPRSCIFGCADTTPPGWGRYYEEQLKLIHWSQNMTADPIMGLVDHTRGYAIAGHSMGGQASTRSAAFAAEYDIVAAIIHHPAGDNGGADIAAPLAAFTGTLDGCCGAPTTRNIFDPAPAPKVYADALDKLHTEPNLFNTIWTAYTAAWVHIHVSGAGPGDYFYDLIYDQANPDSLCGGAIVMDDCELHEG